MLSNFVRPLSRTAFLLATLGSTGLTAVSAAPCPGGNGTYLQVLGSGGPELTRGRASSAYLIWHNQKARVLVDFGGGAALRFSDSGARIRNLDAVLFTHLHVDHSADFAALIKASFFTSRARDLPVWGPTGNRLLPSMTQFVERLFSAQQGVWPYLSGHLPGGRAAYRLQAHNVPVTSNRVQMVYSNGDVRLSAVATEHGPLPALAWRVEVAGRTLVFSGDMNGRRHTLERLARNADILVAHHAIPESATGVARKLHMPPSEIGRIAAQAGVKQLVLSHRMRRILGQEAITEQIIRRDYQGPLAFADDLSCYLP